MNRSRGFRLRKHRSADDWLTPILSSAPLTTHLCAATRLSRSLCGYVPLLQFLEMESFTCLMFQPNQNGESSSASQCKAIRQVPPCARRWLDISSNAVSQTRAILAVGLVTQPTLNALLKNCAKLSQSVPTLTLQGSRCPTGLIWITCGSILKTSSPRKRNKNLLSLIPSDSTRRVGN